MKRLFVKKRFSQVLVKEMTETLDVLPGVLLRYQFRKKKNISLRVYPNGTVVIRAPEQLSLNRLRSFVYAHINWISKRLAQLEKDQAQTLNPKRSFCFMGSLSTLAQHDISCNEIKAWYRRQALIYLSARCVELQNKLPLPPGTELTIKVRWMKRRWGSCRKDGRITLNVALIMCPPSLIDYVIVHELAHLLIAAHNKEFYDLLESWLPGSRGFKRELNNKWGQVLNMVW